MYETIKCKQCGTELEGADLDWFLMTSEKICLKCDTKNEEKRGDRLEKLFIELGEQENV